MMSARHRRSAPHSESSSSSDEEDAFSSMKQKKPRVSSTAEDEVNPASSTNGPIAGEASECSINSNIPAMKQNQVKTAVTSSMKRHHGAISTTRKAKMDALLQELAAEKIIVNEKTFSNQRVSGSFVQPGEENITTNLFVGNLAPHLTQEQVYDVFVQFGPLHSVKIMWARTPEEKSRNRHSGFVCFRDRLDAEEALNGLDDTDAFRLGRHIMVRWGRHVPHHNEDTAVRPNEVGTLEGNIQGKEPPDVETKATTTASRPRSFSSRQRGTDGRELTTSELNEFDVLFRRDLTTSRGTICKAMAFCFDKSGSFHQICKMIQDLIQEEPPKNIPKDIAIEKKTAQLFVLSDILFNSQQPGVRNAFRFRDAIEKMAPDVFTAVGKMEWGGRLTRNKLAVEISAILGAWTNWSVYSPWFLDELQDRFEGRTTKPKEIDRRERILNDEDRPADHEIAQDPDEAETKLRPKSGDELRDRTPNGDWDIIEPLRETQNEEAIRSHNSDGSSTYGVDMQRGKAGNSRGGYAVNGIFLDADDVDGEPYEEDVDGESIDEGTHSEPRDDDDLDDIDGEPIDEGTDGEPFNDDGEPYEDDVDGELIYDIDGEQIGEGTDGEPFDDDTDGVKIE